ncbi:MAG: SsrA-binding protein SmpB [Actinobacteria bacterium]|nr:SsrA-binding protein SmpB [Actinomycetota bacterium]
MAKKKKKSTSGVVSNPKARYNFTILDSFEAGIVLTGTEVKSIRQGKASLQESFAYIKDGEVWLVSMHVAPYEQAGYTQHEPLRKRKLLLHRKEIDKLEAKTKRQGLTLVPLRLYFTRGMAKVELGLAKGKKTFDKREALKAKDAKMQVERSLGRRR